jgi:glycosyltransferase involved in cell wall biosynthesis
VKILQISPTYSGIGGIAQHVRGLENYLKQTDNLVDILSSDNSFTLPIKGLKNPSFMLSSSLKVKFMKKYDIIHAHNIPSAKAMKNAKGKKILSLHGIFSQQVDELHGKTTGTMSKKYENNALKWADAITVVSKEAFDYYVNLGYPVFQIPNAIDISSLTSNKDRRYQKQIIFAGRLSHEKGINLLIELAHKLPFESDLIILGSGPEEKRIQNLIKTQKNVHFLGYQNKEKTISLIRGSDLLIQPSLQEGISSTILEAMACNTLVVATNIGGNKELITDNETGFLVNSNSTSQIIEKINYVLSNPLKSKVITNNAFTYVKQYDWNVIGKKYLNLYQKILD